MKRRQAIRNLVSAGAASLLSRGRGFAADRAADKDDQRRDYVVRSDVRLVLLDVSVKDHAGAFALGLTKDNFTVFENGVSQPITVFERNDLPVTVGLLVDESRSMTPKRGEVLSAALTFVEESNPQDEIFVLNFNERVKRGLPEDILFSDDVRQLRVALYRGVPEGRTALYDAVLAGLRQLEMGRRDKKTLILISDGGDNASRHTRQETIHEVERNIATIYTIGLFDFEDAERDLGILKHLAQISGGAAYFPESPSIMTAICKDIAKDIRTRYTIGYLPPANNAGPLRNIRVNVSAPGHPHLTVRTRTRYRYDEPQEQKAR